MSNTASVQSAVINSRHSYLDVLNESWAQHLAPRAENAPTVISTFAGCGGSSLGYSMAGFRELLAVEWDQNAVDTFRLNFPDVPVYHGDIAKLSVEQILAQTGLKPGALDVFDGSPPCQGFSTAGKRVMTDPRNQLFREYVRLLRGLQPKVFVMENVSGMVKGKMKLIFADILRELKASGYQVSARLMNAMYFNVPQSRQRMIFIGVREDLKIEPTHPRGTGAKVSTGQAIAELMPSDLRPMSSRAAALWHRIPIGSNGTVVSGPNKDFSLFKVNPKDVCPTIRKGQTAGNGLMHWSENRWLSTGEMARFASFPDQYRWLSAESAVNRIGNSVPPLFMRAIAQHIRQHILEAI